jgi:hypothetical protein
VLALPEGRVRDQGIDQWCRDVWSAFNANHRMIASLVAEFKIAQSG